MAKTIRRCAAILFSAAFALAGAQAEPQAAGNQAQPFTVVRTGHFVAGAENPTSADVSCSIAGAGIGATMECRRAGSSKGSYHFDSALVVDANGEGYVIACRVPLVLVLCKKLEIGTMVEGRMGKGTMALTDGAKVRTYAVLASASVGRVPTVESPNRKAPAKAGSQP